jgi:hypothetical protein
VGLSVKIDNTRDFEPVTEMMQPAILADIVDKGLVDNKFKPGTKQQKCYFVWLVAEEDENGKPKRVFESFTVSLNEKATLRKRLKDFGFNDAAAEELKRTKSDLDLDQYIGQTRMLIMNEEDGENGKKFIKVTATMPLKKGMVAPEIPSDFVRKQDQEAK